MRFTGDELVLALISLVRATHPRMLRQEADGFSVDFEAFSKLKQLGPDERLLIKMRAALEPPAENGVPAQDSVDEGQALSLDLTADEARRLSHTLGRLENLQRWPQDVLDMSRALRARLTAAGSV